MWLLDGTAHGGCFIGAAGNLDQVDSCIGQRADGRHGFFFGKSALLEVGRVELDPDRKVLADLPAYFRIHGQYKAAPLFRAAAPGVSPLVVVRRQELADQIAVGAVNLHATEAGFLADGRTAPETLDDLVNFRRGGLARRLKK